MNIGLQLKIARVEKEWTQEELSKETYDGETCISVATIINIEKGQGNPKLKTILRIAKALGHNVGIIKQAL